MVVPANSNGYALSTLLSLISDYHDFNPGPVPVLPYPTPLEFSKQVSRGRPCVYRLKQSAEQQGECHARTKIWTDPSPDGTPEDSRPRTRNFNEQLSEAEAILNCEAFTWTKDRLCELVEEEVEVAVTPDGRADSLYSLPRRDNVAEDDDEEEAKNTNQEEEQESEQEQVFLQPATITMPISTLLDKLTSPSPSSGPVYYLQSQNSNLFTSPLSSLLPSLPSASHLGFATSVLGTPEATNIWIGNAQSVTSTHRDPYENLYLVLTGRKKFILYPPVEEVCLHAKGVRTGAWVYDARTGEFDVTLEGDVDVDDDDDGNGNGNDGSDSSLAEQLPSSESSRSSPNLIPWIPIDPLSPPPPTSTRYPLYRHAHPLTVTVGDGEILYLPAGWFHHVTQECGFWSDESAAPCIAVNYWFDMDYDGEKYIMREMVGRLVERVREENG